MKKLWFPTESGDGWSHEALWHYKLPNETGYYLVTFIGNRSRVTLVESLFYDAAGNWRQPGDEIPLEIQVVAWAYLPLAAEE